tara:strand:+ start:1755 stop:2318 length:564 start_codon:yes stop_codon:yes gene_type:complete
MDKKQSGQKELTEEIKLPEKVNVGIENGVLSLKGEKGEVTRDFSDKKIALEGKDNIIKIDAGKFSKAKKKLIKTYAVHVKNMVKGVTEGHKYVLKICSGHFPMNVSVNNNEITVKNFLGEKVPRTLQLKENATVKVEGDQIVIESTNKEIAGQVSADIEQLTRRTGYDSRIFQDGIYLINRDGKEIK